MTANDMRDRITWVAIHDPPRFRRWAVLMGYKAGVCTWGELKAMAVDVSLRDGADFLMELL